MNNDQWHELKKRLDDVATQYALDISRDGQIVHTYYATRAELLSHNQRILPIVAEYIDETYNGVVAEDQYTEPLPFPDVYGRHINQGD